ncbi:hypothetical protein [Collinsella sp. AF38-3AC]|uniref:hypothetical protein n=1 Tax=Collinsella sp. AF38-3AC TaxID=2292015 RepID=UPI000E534073|nr:hypothetical protein [Collinsella sp. AF38-3AC]RHL22619.1 hypothetical protein DW029_08190 [Collinsella sp. AF38-3AC]
MIIAIEYKNGRMKEFDTSAFTATNAMSAGDKTARNVLTELDLRLDLVDEVGLRLDFYWYDATPQGQRVKIDGLTDSKGDPACLTSASRRLGTSVLLCSRMGIQQISRVIVQRANGTVDALWRQGSGDWLINGARFEAQRVLSYTDCNVTSMNSQAVFVFKYLKKSNPEMADDEICNLIGYPLEAYKEIQWDEAKNAEGLVGADLIESDDEEDPSFPSDPSAADPSDPPANPSLGKHFAVDDDDDGFDDDEDSLFDV